MEKVLTVVYVDDEPRNQLALRRILSFDARFKLIAELATGQEALRICPSLFPDFIIVDASVVDMSLLELVTQLMELCPTSAIITTSISDSPDYMQQMLLVGVRYYLSKPFFDVHVIDTLINIDRHRRQSWFGDEALI